MLFNTLFLKEFLHIAKGRFIGHCLNGTGTVYVVLAKQNFRVLMRHGLVCTGEVQVDIRHLVPIEPQEYGEWYVVAVLNKRCTADRTVHIRQVIAAAVGTIGNKFAVLAMRATPVRRQGVNLRYPRHRGDKGRTYGTTGTYQISIVI